MRRSSPNPTIPVRELLKSWAMPREGSHRLHLLGRPHLVLEQSQLRDIPKVPEHENFPGNRHRTRLDIGPEDRAVLSPYRDINYFLGFMPRTPVKFLDNPGDVLVGVDIHYSQLSDLIEGILHHVAKGIVGHIEFLAIRVDHNDPVFGILEDSPEFLFRLFQFPLRLLAYGDVTPVHIRVSGILNRRYGKRIHTFAVLQIEQFP